MQIILPQVKEKKEKKKKRDDDRGSEQIAHYLLIHCLASWVGYYGLDRVLSRDPLQTFNRLLLETLGEHELEEMEILLSHHLVLLPGIFSSYALMKFDIKSPVPCF